MSMVSIVIAAYNAEAFLTACLDSVLAQTIGDWEVVVVDDHSTDATADLVRGYMKRDDRFRLTQTPRNGGPSAARNIGIAAARGTWIAILDADDQYEPSRLERMVAHGDAQESDIVSDNLMLVTEGSRQRTKMFTDPLMERAHRVGLEEFILGNIGKPDEPRIAYGFMKPLMQAAFLKENGIAYDERMRFSEDFVLYITCLQRGARWDYVPDATYLYTVRDDSLSGGEAARQPSDLRPIFDFSRALMQSDMAKTDPGSRRAASLYYKKVRRWYSYRSLVEHVKRRQLGQAASLLYRSPDAIGDIVAEAMVQAPALARKAARKISGRSAPGH